MTFRIRSQLCELIRAWWRVDLIRTSPREGSLLRLSAGCILEIAGEFWVVESRTVGTGPAGNYLTYRCSSAGRLAVLTVSPAGSGREQVHWEVEHRTVPAAAEDFAVFGSTLARA